MRNIRYSVLSEGLLSGRYVNIRTFMDIDVGQRNGSRPLESESQSPNQCRCSASSFIVWGRNSSM